jgi:hypothetical protein
MYLSINGDVVLWTIGTEIEPNAVEAAQWYDDIIMTAGCYYFDSDWRRIIYKPFGMHLLIAMCTS